jgi:hypothetical protein
MKTLFVIAAAASLAAAASAQAQTAPHAKRHPHVSRHYRIDPYAGTSDVYVREGRAAAYDAPVPAFAWSPRTQEEGVGAELVGPGSVGDSPTGEHDVSR